jgi:hypothetical protein
MMHGWWALIVFSLSWMAASPSTALDQPPSAREYWEVILGGQPGEQASFLAPATPGTLWDNGAFDGVNGLTSERATFAAGTGGPEGNDISTIANDFELNFGARIQEIRACMLHNGTSAELYIYSDSGGAPALPVTAPLFGAPTTADVVSSTFTDNTTRCNGAFGFPGREYTFNELTTGVQFPPALPPGRYWLAVVAIGGTRGFWATSDLSATPQAQASLMGQIGSSFFTYPYWSPVTIAGDFKEFAFDIDGIAFGAPTPVFSAPVILSLGLMLAAAGALALRRGRRR